MKIFNNVVKFFSNISTSILGFICDSANHKRPLLLQGQVWSLTCVICSSTWIPRGFIWTRGNTQVSSSPSLIPSSSESSDWFNSRCLMWAVSTTSMIRFLATAEKSSLLPGCCRGDTKCQCTHRWSGRSGDRQVSLISGSLCSGLWVCLKEFTAT